jgi:hypothetical protein
MHLQKVISSSSTYKMVSSSIQRTISFITLAMKLTRKKTIVKIIAFLLILAALIHLYLSLNMKVLIPFGGRMEASNSTITLLNNTERFAVVMPEAPNADFSFMIDFPDLEFAMFPYAASHSNTTEIPFRTPANKGTEAMTYLTYIIQNYDRLPDKMLFIHGHVDAWHQPIPIAGYLRVIQWRKIMRFINLAGCDQNADFSWKAGEPSEAKYELRTLIDKFFNETKLHEKYGFPLVEPHTVIKVNWCAQFLVTKEEILRNPKQMYIDLRNWILKTDIEDYWSGRIFEYTWHIFFTWEFIVAPSVGECNRVFASQRAQ